MTEPKHTPPDASAHPEDPPSDASSGATRREFIATATVAGSV